MRRPQGGVRCEHAGPLGREGSANLTLTGPNPTRPERGILSGKQPSAARTTSRRWCRVTAPPWPSPDRHPGPTPTRTPTRRAAGGGVLTLTLTLTLTPPLTLTRWRSGSRRRDHTAAVRRAQARHLGQFGHRALMYDDKTASPTRRAHISHISPDLSISPYISLCSTRRTRSTREPTSPYTSPIPPYTSLSPISPRRTRSRAGCCASTALSCGRSARRPPRPPHPPHPTPPAHPALTPSAHPHPPPAPPPRPPRLEPEPGRTPRSAEWWGQVVRGGGVYIGSFWGRRSATSGASSCSRRAPPPPPPAPTLNPNPYPGPEPITLTPPLPPSPTKPRPRAGGDARPAHRPEERPEERGGPQGERAGQARAPAKAHMCIVGHLKKRCPPSSVTRTHTEPPDPNPSRGSRALARTLTPNAHPALPLDPSPPPSLSTRALRLAPTR